MLRHRAHYVISVCCAEWGEEEEEGGTEGADDPGVLLGLVALQRQQFSPSYCAMQRHTNNNNKNEYTLRTCSRFWRMHVIQAIT